MRRREFEPKKGGRALGRFGTGTVKFQFHDKTLLCPGKKGMTLVTFQERIKAHPNSIRILKD